MRNLEREIIDLKEQLDEEKSIVKNRDNEVINLKSIIASGKEDKQKLETEVEELRNKIEPLITKHQQEIGDYTVRVEQLEERSDDNLRIIAYLEELHHRPEQSVFEIVDESEGEPNEERKIDQIISPRSKVSEASPVTAAKQSAVEIVDESEEEPNEERKFDPIISPRSRVTEASPLTAADDEIKRELEGAVNFSSPPTTRNIADISTIESSSKGKPGTISSIKVNLDMMSSTKRNSGVIMSTKAITGEGSLSSDTVKKRGRGRPRKNPIGK